MGFEAGETSEARHLRDLDKFEMVLQASEYEEAQGLPLSDFFRTTEGKFGTGLFKELDAEVRRRRAKRQQQAPQESAQGDDVPPQSGPKPGRLTGPSDRRR